MLKEGYHKSFRELDFILKLQIKERHRVGSEHPVWSRPLLDHEEEKLSYLCRKLNKAEAAERSGEFKILYTNYFDLANYFIITDDSWLSDYFFQKCLGITDGPGIFSDNRQLEPELQAEAECNIGFSFEKQSKIFLFLVLVDISQVQKRIQILKIKQLTIILLNRIKYVVK